MQKEELGLLTTLSLVVAQLQPDRSREIYQAMDALIQIVKAESITPTHEKMSLDAVLEKDAKPYDIQTSIAISLKRIADHITPPLVEIPLRHGGVAHIRPSQVANVSVHGQHQDVAFVQMIGDTGENGFTTSISCAEVMERLKA